MRVIADAAPSLNDGLLDHLVQQSVEHALALGPDPLQVALSPC
jgi:hypothetical protein